VAGVTLVELLVVITLVSLLMMIGVPSYRYVTNSARVSGEINSLLADMQLARSEAVKEGAFVSICASSNGASCSKANNGWNSGWIVFSNVKGDGVFDTTNDALIKVGPAFNSNDVITTVGLTAISVVTFNREGFAALPTGGTTTSDQTAAGVTLQLNVNPANVRWERCLNITWVGSMTTQRGGDADTACN
jgi:type IV fimbrial biogenesis protein FimT